MKNIFIVCLIVITSCINDGDKASGKNHENLVQDDTEGNPKRKEVEKTIKTFLTWYKKNYRVQDTIHIVPQIYDTLENQYTVDINKVNEYILYLKGSGILSDEYLLGLKQYIISCEKKMITDHQTDGPPNGLESDLILCTQETEESFSKIPDKIRFSNYRFENNVYSIEVELAYTLLFSLSKKDDKWEIIDIKSTGR